jgi:catechol 2,3-dioxygenase-like lactoylglutathione lyase family enzyme
MRILASAKPVVVVCTRDRDRARAFYRDTLGLSLRREDEHAVVLEAGNTAIHIAAVPGFTPHGHTMLGFVVADVDGAVRALAGKGVAFLRFPDFPHDEMGVLSLPGGKGRVAWFPDPDGNILSITDAG